MSGSVESAGTVLSYQISLNPKIGTPGDSYTEGNLDSSNDNEWWIFQVNNAQNYMVNWDDEWDGSVDASGDPIYPADPLVSAYDISGNPYFENIDSGFPGGNATNDDEEGQAIFTSGTTLYLLAISFDPDYLGNYAVKVE